MENKVITIIISFIFKMCEKIRGTANISDKMGVKPVAL